MAAHVLVPIDRRDRVEDLLPYIEFIARPGSAVTFLLRVDANFFPWWLEAVSLPTREGSGDMTLDVLSATASVERQREEATGRIAGMRRVLEGKGLRVEVECYRGRLGLALDRLCRTDTRTVVLRSRKPSLIASWAPLLRFGRFRMAPAADAMMMLSLLRT
jgi:hypothetical protein